MTDYPYLPNAPIVEALVDLRVQLPAGFNVEVLRDLHGSVAATYPRVEAQRLLQGKLHFSREGMVAQGPSRAVLGFRMLSEDGRNVVQFRRDGFTFSRLRPYTEWPALYEEAWRLWELYREVAQPSGVSRLATRFINRLQCPPSFRLEEYFRAPPEIPAGVPNVMASFLYRYVLAPVDGITSNVTLATEPSAPGVGYTSVVFDIDCYVNKEFRPDEAERIASIFANLHDMKNRIFFSSLTDKAIDAFK